MTVINTNVASLNAQASMASNARGLSKAMQQLSTGKRISSASDDAAGLAISTRLTSQIRGLNQAVRNANDGISLIQIAEGASVEITNMLQRMRELAVQSANDTNTDGDRSFLNQEFQQLKEEINRIGATVEWNGTKIMDGTFGTFEFQVGANANQVISLDIGDFRTYEGEAALTVDNASSGGVQTSTFDLSDLNNLFDADDRYALAGQTVTVEAAGKKVNFTITKELLDLVDDQTADLAELVIEGDATAEITGLADLLEDALGTDFTVSHTVGDTDFDVAETGSAGFAVAISFNAGNLSMIGSSAIDQQAYANSAIDAIDDTLDEVNSQRATMGATINRLQYSVDNLTNVSTRSSEARSRIEDTDYATSTMELAKRQIIQQAATAMLAQANQQPQQVLTLLK